MGLMVATWAEEKKSECHVIRGIIGLMGLASQLVKPPMGGMNRADPLSPPTDQMIMGINLRPATGESDAEYLVTRPGLLTWKDPATYHPQAFSSVPGDLDFVASLFGDLYSVDQSNAATTRIFDSSVGTAWAFQTAKNSSGLDRLWASQWNNAAKKIHVNNSGVWTVEDWLNTPPKGRAIKLWRGRMIVWATTTPDRLFFSDIGNPESPATNYGTNWVDLRGEFLSKETALAIVGENLLAFKEAGIWIIYDPNDFTNRVVTQDHGVANAQAVAEYGGKVFFLDTQTRMLCSTDGISVKIECKSFGEMAGNSDAKLTLDEIGGKLYVDTPFGIGSQYNGYFLEVDLNRKNSLDEYPVFLHKVTDAAGTPTLIKAENSDLVVGAYASASRANALIWGTFNTEKSLKSGVSSRAGTVTPTFAVDGGVNSEVFTIIKRGIQPGEKIERLRRVNLRYRGVPDISVSTQDFEVDIPGDITEPSSYAFTGTMPTLGFDLSATWGHGKVRPETRGRLHVIKVARGGTKSARFDVGEMELVYRGGKES